MHALQIAMIALQSNDMIVNHCSDCFAARSGMRLIPGGIAPTLAVAAMQQRADGAAGRATSVIRVRAAGAWSPFFCAIVKQEY
jgi:hypothetical protein